MGYSKESRTEFRGFRPQVLEFNLRRLGSGLSFEV